VLKNRKMSEVVTYLLYAILVVVLAMAGRYIGDMYKYPGTGTLIGGAIGVGLAYWHSTTNNEINTKYNY
jgi:hypothetical protein